MINNEMADRMIDTVSSEIFQALVESIPEPICLSDSRGFEYTIYIRNGIVEFIDSDMWIGIRFSTGNVITAVDVVSQWLRQALSTRLKHEFHGRIAVRIQLTEGQMRFLPSIRQQYRYNWDTP